MNFNEGDPALLIDSKGRHFLLKLEAGRTFRYHQGSVLHSDLIGAEDGSWIEASTGTRLLLLRPRLADYILKMKRGAQVVYPKDLGPILVYADIGPGMTVLEAGTGSGALTLALARAVGTTGRVVSVEQRDDHLAHARKTIERWHGKVPDNIELRTGDVEDQAHRLAYFAWILILRMTKRATQSGSNFTIRAACKAATKRSHSRNQTGTLTLNRTT